MGWWFGAARSEGYPTHYPDQHSPARTDVLLAGLLTAFLIILFSVIVVLPAYTSRKRFIFVFLYTLLSLFIGGAVLLGNYGHEWEVGEVEITSPYKPASAEEIQGKIGLHISLRGINVTLKGRPKEEDSVELRNEVIDYNEHFSWTWAQGRFGFGPYAGQISRDFRAAVIRGTPTPILQLAEYFTFDGEGIRFGRHYRLAGWYTHFFMWCAFITWILSNILFFMVVKHGRRFLILTGLFQIIAILIWVSIRNSVELSVPFESKSGSHEVMLRTRFGPDFYIVLFNGLFCTVIGAVMFVLELYFPEEICEVFGIDPLSAFEEVMLTPEEHERELGRFRRDPVEMVPMRDRIGAWNARQHPPLQAAASHITVRRRKSHGKSYYFNARRQRDRISAA